MAKSYQEENPDHENAEESMVADGLRSHLRRHGGGVTNAAQAPSDGWFWPGPNTGVGVRELRPGEQTLVLFLDPVSLVVAMPPLPGGEIALARFCRLLARAARQLAATSHHDPGQAIPTRGES